MKFIFPLVTLRNKGRFEFREKFWSILESNYTEYFIISPFIDSKIFTEIFKVVAMETGKNITLISRPPDTKFREADFQIIKDNLSHNQHRYRLGMGNTLTWFFDRHLHAKVLIADYSVVLFGSQNITYNGLGDDLSKSECNNELGICIEDLKGSEQVDLKEFVDTIIKSSIQIFPTL